MEVTVLSETYKTLELVCQLYEHYDRCYITATTNGEHTRNSLHYVGQALDIGSGLRGNSAAILKAQNVSRAEGMAGLAAWLYGMSSMISELFHHSGSATSTSHWYVKDGVRRSRAWAIVRGLATVAESQDHIHVGVTTQRDADRMLTNAAQAALGLTRDAVYGPKTEAAVRAVQSSAGITVDGKIGPATVAAIRAHRGWPKV